jgi:putative DNA methylase
MTERKKLIEVALPLEAINLASVREKSMRHGHPSTLHLWWARRPLAACRAVLFASIVDDPSSYIKDEQLAKVERKRLFNIIEKLVIWENSNDPATLNAARMEIARSVARSKGDTLPDKAKPDEILKYIAENVPPILDPFCGGGSIPLEAQRLGLTAYASDLNPIAVLITKALIEIPPKFANKSPVNPHYQNSKIKKTWHGTDGLAEDVQYYGDWLRTEAEKKIGHLYPKAKLPDGSEATVIAWLWARTAKCPNPACGASMPLVRSFWVSKKAGRKAWVEPVIDKQSKTVRFIMKLGEGEPKQASKVARGANFKCLVCEELADDEYIKKEGRENRMGSQLMAIVGEGKRGRVYFPPNEEHISIIQQALPKWAPEEELPYEPRAIWCTLYGLTHYKDLFTSRQLVALTTFSDLINEARMKALQDAKNAGFSEDSRGINESGTGAIAYADAIATYLAFLLDQLANHQSSICTWNAPNIQMRNVFARQGIPMSWDYAESNPFCESSGSYHNLHERQVKGFTMLPAIGNNYVYQLDASEAKYNISSVIVSTDPPYYDNIGYADLSDFFYVWLRKSIGTIYPDLFSTLLTPKKQELIASPYRHNGDTHAAEKHFLNGFNKTFSNLSLLTNKSYPMTIFYAFKQTEEDVDTDNESVSISSTGWETMLDGLINSKYNISGTWPFRTEKQGRSTEIGTNALASSIVLVCRPRPDNAPMATRREFLAALKSELPAALQKLQDENIAPVDLAQSSIGPGIAIFSRYSKVVEPDGSAMTVRTALQIINQELDSFLRQEEGDMDAETQFCVQWFEQYGMNPGAFGDANTLAQAKNTSVDKPRAEYPLDWNPVTDTHLTLWECAQHLIKQYLEGGETAAAELATKLGVGRSEDAKVLAYRLYSVCERKGWAEDARPYNELVTAWPEIQRKAAGISGAGPQKVFEVIEGRKKK